ncbi:endothelial lipase [Nasonia vitripennis]|uniref:phospholipase A1 n=1 Tax=Nasonia vitripennis TaxID=7425 RepID=A0A7M7QGW8_NASVI|nr:endothelial lipase [Nasonia vitripennis]
MPWYHKAVGNTRIVGPHVASTLRWLESIGAFNLRAVHVVGFSLGAEVAGFMGKALFPQRVGRITGLDAAYPLYMNTGAEGHLTAADAEFVDIIHTDGGVLGFPIPLGHVDFYPNGGMPPQPGCNVENVFAMGVNKIVNRFITCSHNRAWRLYAESITDPAGFPASRCPKWRPDLRVNCQWSPDALMGYAATRRLRGMYYLRTNANSPFARNITGYC